MSGRGSAIEYGVACKSFAKLESLIAEVNWQHFNFAICMCVCVCARTKNSRLNPQIYFTFQAGRASQEWSVVLHLPHNFIGIVKKVAAAVFFLTMPTKCWTAMLIMHFPLSFNAWHSNSKTFVFKQKKRNFSIDRMYHWWKHCSSSMLFPNCSTVDKCKLFFVHLHHWTFLKWLIVVSHRLFLVILLKK